MHTARAERAQALRRRNRAPASGPHPPLSRGECGAAATAGVAAALSSAARCRLDAAAGVDADTGRARADAPLAVKENAPRTSPVEVPTPAPVASAAPPVADAVAEQQRRVAAARSRLWEANCELMAKDRALHDARKRIAATSGPCAADQAVMKKLQRVRSAKELRTLQAGKANEGGESDCESELTI